MRDNHFRFMKKTLMSWMGAAALIASAVVTQADDNPFLGAWAFTTPDGGAGWLCIKEMPGGYLDGSMLWVAGSVVPVDSIVVTQQNGREALIIYRVYDENRKDKDGKVFRTQRYVDTIFGTLDGDTIRFMQVSPNRNGKGVNTSTFTGKKMAPIPPAPDLGKVKYGKPIKLFNGKNLDGWRLTNENAANGWFADNGILVCDPKQEEGKPHKNYGNLRTDAEFEDFNLTLKAKVEKGGNSGIYLRGVCEIQVTDSYGKNLDSHHMGGLYSRVTPSVSAEKPAGEWQEFDITYCDQHVTVKLNGKTIIDNAAVEGCTGGALWSDITKPGPIYLQGDHTGVMYKDIVLRPIEK